MKKNSKKTNKKKIIVLLIIIIIIISIVVLYSVKSNYLRKYNAEKYRFSVTFREIDQYFDRDNYFKNPNIICNEKNYCIDKKYGHVFSEIVTEKCDDSSNRYRYTKKANTKEERCKNTFNFVLPTYEGINLSGVVEGNDNKIEANIFYINQSFMDNKIHTNDISNFLIDYLSIISNYEEKKNNTYQDEFKHFCKKMNIKVHKSEIPKDKDHKYLYLEYPHQFNTWNFYKSYSPNKLYLSDSLVKILDEYHTLKFYNYSFEYLKKFDLSGLDINSYQNNITVTRVNRLDYQEFNPIYIIKFDDRFRNVYLVFWNTNYILEGFNGWSEEKVEDFASTLYKK